MYLTQDQGDLKLFFQPTYKLELEGLEFQYFFKKTIKIEIAFFP